MMTVKQLSDISTLIAPNWMFRSVAVEMIVPVIHFIFRIDCNRFEIIVIKATDIDGVVPQITGDCQGLVCSHGLIAPRTEDICHVL